MAYTKTTWVDGVTPVSAQNMNKLETQYEKAKADLDTHKADNATKEELGHIKLSDITKGFSKIVTLPSNKWVCPGWFFVDTGTQLFNVDTIYYIPIYVAEETSFSEVGVGVSSSTGATSAELAIYKFNDDNLPGELLINLGTIDTSTAGVKSILTDLTLREGYYFAAIRIIGGNQTLAVVGTLSGSQFTPPVISGEATPLSGAGSKNVILRVSSGTASMGVVAQQPDSSVTSSFNAVRFKQV